MERLRALADSLGSARQYLEADKKTKRETLIQTAAADAKAAYTVRAMVDAYPDEAGKVLKGWRESGRSLRKVNTSCFLVSDGIAGALAWFPPVNSFYRSHHQSRP